MKTKAETITREIEIWARPPYSFEGDVGTPFVYTVGRPWHETEVMVCKATITVDIPAGIDLMAAAIDTLRAKQDEVRAKAEAEVTKIQKQINELLLIGHESNAVEVAPAMKGKCDIRYFSDMQECIACGQSWDANDPCPPDCNAARVCPHGVRYGEKCHACDDDDIPF